MTCEAILATALDAGRVCRGRLIGSAASDRTRRLRQTVFPTTGGRRKVGGGLIQCGRAVTIDAGDRERSKLMGLGIQPLVEVEGSVVEREESGPPYVVALGHKNSIVDSRGMEYDVVHCVVNC